MDILSQSILGASVGQAVLGKKIGRRAAGLGAIGGLAPDADVFFSPLFASEVDGFLFHRGLTHSIFFAVVVGGLLAWLFSRRQRYRQHTSFKDWWLFWGLIFGTHALLDGATMYGTRILEPFSDFIFGFDSLFIIDPLYTFPFLGCLLWALSRSEADQRQWWNRTGLIISTSYIALSFVFHLQALQSFRTDLADQGITPTHLMATPAPLTNLLWSGIAATDDTIYTSSWSVLNPHKPMTWHPIDRNLPPTADISPQSDTQKLIDFSRGFYAFTEQNNQRYLHDVRFTTPIDRPTRTEDHMWSYIIATRDENGLWRETVTMLPPSRDIQPGDWQRLWEMVLGK